MALRVEFVLCDNDWLNDCGSSDWQFEGCFLLPENIIAHTHPLMEHQFMTFCLFCTDRSGQ